MDRAGLDLPPKSLRKTFATVCLNELSLDPALLEAYLGHKHPGATGVTKRHYLKRLGAESLRPLAKAVDDAMSHKPRRDGQTPLLHGPKNNFYF